MPSTFNGIGTQICESRGDVIWTGGADCDAVECFVVLGLPLLPLKAVHTFNWQPDSGEHGLGMHQFREAYQAVPIWWSLSLVARAIARRWLLAVLAVGLVALGIQVGMVFYLDRPPHVPGITLAAVGVCIAILGLWSMHRTNQRHMAIRRVLGQHQFGSSDPADWDGDLLAHVRSPKEMFGTDRYADAVLPALQAGQFSAAMWAARLSVAQEDRDRAEVLTNNILDDPRVREAVAHVSRSPQCWSHAMQAQPHGADESPAAQ